MSNKNPPLAVPCPDAKEIYLYATGGYDEKRATDIETHLLLCAECETLLDSLDDPSDAIIRALATLPISPDDENSYQQLRTAALAQPVEIPQAADATAQLQRLSRLADPALGPLPYLLGNYELQACIGRGASGAVYRARHLKLDQIVAVKVLDPSRSFAADSFLQEMKTIGSLAHPHIVRATDAGEADGLHFLVMEYIDGIDAARLLFRNGPLRVADACEITRQAASGLQFVHERSLVHRDIKPSNLLVTAEGQVKLLDLGIAIRSVPGQSPQDGDPVKPQGTSDYMAPEQWTQPATVDRRADLYSLGCTLHRLLTGHIPAKPYVAPPHLPRPLKRLLQRLVAPAPDDRPRSAAEVIASLRPFVRGDELQTLVSKACPSMVAPAPATKPLTDYFAPSRRNLLAGLATAGAVAMLFSRFRFGNTPQLQKTAWRGLTPLAPQLLLTLDKPNNATLQVGADDEVSVSSESLTLIHLGRPVSGLFKIEVDLLQQNWQGGGIFFRWQHDASQETPLFSFQSVELQPCPDINAPLANRRLLWSQWTAQRATKQVGGEITTHQTALADIEVELSANSQPQHLQVVCGRQGMPEIAWNGQRLHPSGWQLSIEARNLQRLGTGQLSTAFLGRLGLLNSQGTTTFLQPRLAYL